MVGREEKEAILTDQLFSSGVQRTVSFPLSGKGCERVRRRIGPGLFKGSWLGGASSNWNRKSAHAQS